MNIIKYTDHEVIKNLALLETHLKQAPSDDESFCSDCINKHLILIEGLAEEGMTAGGDEKRYQEIYDFAKEIRGKDYVKVGISLANKTRQARKSFADCPECVEKLGSRKSKAIKNLTKNLNTPESYYDLADESVQHTNNSFEANQLNGNKNNMAKIDFAKVGYMTAGQFAAEGIKYVGETFPTTEPGKWGKWINIGGGAALAILPMFVKLPTVAKDVSMVAGTNLLAGGVVQMIKDQTAEPPAARIARARMGNGNMAYSAGASNGNMAYSTGAVGGTGKGYRTSWKLGGSTPKKYGGAITATGIPTEYARSGILSDAQQFGDPAHAGLIRVD